MFSKSTVHDLAKALLKRTLANEVDWTQVEGKLCVALPEFVISLSRPTAPQGGESDIVVEVDTDAGQRVVGYVQIKSSEVEYSDFAQLVEHAESYVADWDRRLLNAAKQIELGSGRVGTTTIPFSPPARPPQPTEEEAQRFFEKIAGKWDLRFEKKPGTFGTETLEIDKNGNYFILSDLRDKVVTRTVYPKFRLSLVSCDQDLEHVEISKQEFNGRVRQVEVLLVSSASMVGYAKHDERRLEYTRRK